jgi:hypothetical protein
MVETDYNKIIERAGLVSAGMIPYKYSNIIIQEAVTESAMLSKMRKLPNMSSRVESMPVMNLFPTAYFVDSEAGDGGATYSEGLGKTTRQMWGASLLTAAKLMVLVPIPKDTIADAEGFGYDLWGEVKPRIVEVTSRTIDRAILQGLNKPTAWPLGIIQGAVAKSMIVEHKADVKKDYYDEILGEGGLFDLVEKKRYPVDGIIADISMKAGLRGMRSTIGTPIFPGEDLADMASKYGYALDGVPIDFPANAALNAAEDAVPALMIAGNFNSAVYSWRTDMALSISDVSTITDNEGKVVYNAFQQDLVIAKLTVRLGWQLPITAHISGVANRYPFAALTPAA